MELEQVPLVPLEQVLKTKMELPMGNPPARLDRGSPSSNDLPDHSHGMSRTPAPGNQQQSVLFCHIWRRPPAAGNPRRRGLSGRTCSIPKLGTAQGHADPRRRCTLPPGYGGSRPTGGLVTSSSGILASRNAPRGGHSGSTSCTYLRGRGLPRDSRCRSGHTELSLCRSTRGAAAGRRCKGALGTRQPNGRGPGCWNRSSTLGTGNPWCGEGDPWCARPSCNGSSSAAAAHAQPTSLDRSHFPQHLGRPAQCQPPDCQGSVGHGPSQHRSWPLLRALGHPLEMLAGRSESESESESESHRSRISIRARPRDSMRSEARANHRQRSLDGSGLQMMRLLDPRRMHQRNRRGGPRLPHPKRAQHRPPPFRP